MDSTVAAKLPAASTALKVSLLLLRVRENLMGLVEVT